MPVLCKKNSANAKTLFVEDSDSQRWNAEQQPRKCCLVLSHLPLNTSHIGSVLNK